MITLATLPTASLQDIFTQARDHLLKQNCKSNWKGTISTDLTCKYRGHNGTMCAVGCFISDEEYSIDMDTKGLTNLGGLVQQGLFPRLEDEKLYLLHALQIVHDQNEPTTWAEKLLELAIKYNLEWV